MCATLLQFFCDDKQVVAARGGGEDVYVAAIINFQFFLQFLCRESEDAGADVGFGVFRPHLLDAWTLERNCFDNLEATTREIGIGSVGREQMGVYA